MRRAAACTALAAASVLFTGACSSGQSTVGVSATAGAKATLAASAQNPPGPVTVPGYSYEPPSAELAKSLDDLLSGDSTAYESGTVREVMHNGNAIGSLYVLQTRPSFAEGGSDQLDPQQVVKDSAESKWKDVSVSKETINSQNVYVAKGTDSGDHMAEYLWLRGDVETTVIGADDAATRGFVDAYLNKQVS